MKLHAKTAIFAIIALLLGSALILCWKLSRREQLSLETIKNKPSSQEVPTAHHINNVPYYSEVTGNTEGFCYGYSSMMLLEHNGFTKEEVIAFRDLIQKEGRGGPPDIFLGFENMGLIDKIHIGYSKDHHPEFAKIYSSFVANENNQIKIFDTQEEAIEKLKQLILQDTPVMVLINNGTDYDVAIGYDPDYIYLNDPHDKGGADVKIPWNKFLSEWNSEEAGAPGEVAFPGNWGMIWLEK